MNGPGDLQLSHSSETPDPKNCSIVSIIPIVGMSSCRGRAEAFARRLSSKLRTLGSQADEDGLLPEDEPMNGGNTNTWMTGHENAEQTVTDLQPLRHESDSFFDFDCELESPGSPVDECEYLRLIESTSNTPHNSAAESGYVCASAASSHSSSDGPYFDVNSENESCNTNQPQQQEQHQQQKQHTHICQPHQTEKDEVDCVQAVVKTTDNGFHPLQCNGYQNHDDSVTPQTESHIKSEDDLIQNLPCEGPDIEMEKTNENHINLKSNGMTQTVQDQILQDQILLELQKQSLDYSGDENDNNNTINFEKQPTEICPAEEQQKEPQEQQQDQQQDSQKVTITLVNGYAGTEEDVLEIELAQDVLEVQATEVKKEEGEETEIEKVVAEIKEITTDSSPVTTEVVACVEIDPPKPAETTTVKKSTHLHMDTTDDEDDCRPQRVRRCSSLKTGKTPPGTPGNKKIVRFADVLGLDLADVKTFLDEIPTIPKSAYEDLEILENEPPMQLGPKSHKLLMPLFQQPGGLPKFLDIVREKLVSLENAAVTDTINHTITGSVRVRNLDFNKSVHIRYSLDGWRSYADLQANYVENSCDGFSDTFSFVIFGNSLHIGQRLEFAVRFQCKGQQYWDNNYGSNYVFQCLPTSTPTTQPISVLPSHHHSNLVGVLSPTVGESWCTSFY